MNKCLLAKWTNQNRKTIVHVVSLLINKYLIEKSFFSSNNRGGSQCWFGLHEAQKECLRWLNHIVNNGKKTRFLLDVWYGECHFKIRFHNLYEIYDQQDQNVAKVMQGDNLKLTFRRNFGTIECQELDELTDLIESVILNEEADTLSYELEKYGKITTTSLYRT